MSAETGVTALTNIINSEVIEQDVADYLIDANVISPISTYRSIAGRASKVWTFTRWSKDSGNDITDGTGLSGNTVMAMTETSATVGVVGIAREVTDFASETTIMGPAQLYNRVFQDGAALSMEMLEDDLAALPASFTGTTVGTSGVDMSVANFIEAIARLRTAKARGKYVCVLDDQQSYDLSAAVAAATGAVWGNQSVDNTILNSRSDGYVGSLLGVDIWYTNLTDTANGGADVEGGMWLDPASNDEQCATAWVELWAPRVRARVDPYMVSQEISVTMAYGVAAKYPAAGIPIVTDA
jgi:hypothetical protein